MNISKVETVTIFCILRQLNNLNLCGKEISFYFSHIEREKENRRQKSVKLYSSFFLFILDLTALYMSMYEKEKKGREMRRTKRKRENENQKESFITNFCDQKYKRIVIGLLFND